MLRKDGFWRLRMHDDVGDSSSKTVQEKLSKQPV